MCLFGSSIPLDSISLFVGLGCALSWISTSKYIEHSPKLSFFSRTIQHAAPNIMRHAINMLPFFIGFGMLAMAVFWPTYRFRSPFVTYFSLFSIMLGDEISNSFMETIQFDPLFGPVFMFCWVFLSMSVMMNLFIIIVGESFEIVRETNKFNWLTDERIITMDSSQREFDDSSSSCSSSDDNKSFDDDKNDGSSSPDKVTSRIIDKRLKSVRTLKQIIDDDYNECSGLNPSINHSPTDQY